MIEIIAKLKKIVTPANEVPRGEAGVQKSLKRLDSCFRRNDTKVDMKMVPLFEIKGF